LHDPEYTHGVRVSLRTDNDNILRWDEVCHKAVELFGLPGERYITDIDSNFMDWIFKDSEDALLFKLKFSEVML
jgi:hypothetical protein